MSCGKVFAAFQYHQIDSMKKIMYLLLSATLFATSCKKDKDPEPTTPTPTPEAPAARVKFVNACINSNTVNVKIADTNFSAVSGLTFLQSTDYLKTAVGNNLAIAFWYSNSGITLATGTRTLNDDASYTAYVGGVTPGTAPFVITDDYLSAPASGKAKVRFINLSNEDFNMDFYVGGPKLDSVIATQEYTPFYEVTAGSKNVIIADPAQIGYTLTNNGFNFEAGKIYTFMLTGLKNGTNDAELKITVLNNN